MQSISELMATLPQVGAVDWIGVRPSVDEPMRALETVQVNQGSGLEGDRFRAKNNDREVTLIQAEHIGAVSSMLGRPVVPALLRRNMVVGGINLLALKDKTFQVGEVVLRYTGLADPCSKMEAALGPGGYNAMRGHGGITASVVSGGTINCGDAVRALS